MQNITLIERSDSRGINLKEIRAIEKHIIDVKKTRIFMLNVDNQTPTERYINPKEYVEGIISDSIKYLGIYSNPTHPSFDRFLTHPLNEIKFYSKLTRLLYHIILKESFKAVMSYYKGRNIDLIVLSNKSILSSLNHKIKHEEPYNVEFSIVDRIVKDRTLFSLVNSVRDYRFKKWDYKKLFFDLIIIAKEEDIETYFKESLRNVLKRAEKYLN